MILVDISNIQMATLFSKDMSSIVVDPYYFKHTLLFRLSEFSKRFKKKYGRMVLCYDNPHNGYWRKDIFPLYKGTRKAFRESLEVDWKNFYKACDELESEIDKKLSWITLKINKAEADDLIGVISKYWHLYEPILIISVDQDFFQLQQYKNVNQWNHITGKMLKVTNPEWHLKEKIIRGDKGDGIPNIKSADNAIIQKIRQQSIYAKEIKNWVKKEPEEYCNGEMLNHYKRNETMIDFDHIPEKYVKDIKTTFAEKFNFPTNGNPMMYLSEMKYRNLLENVGYL